MFMKTYFSLKSILNNYPPAPANPEIPSARDKLLADIAKAQRMELFLEEEQIEKAPSIRGSLSLHHN